MASVHMLLLNMMFLLSLLPSDARNSIYPADVCAGILCNVTSIYQFGDSLSDTGNLIREGSNGGYLAIAHPPYDQSLYKHPTGRCSNGLLMIDFIAKTIGIPPLEPYLNKDAVFSQGVNFAVAGATALPAESLASKSIANPVTNSSLGVQLDWMWSYFNSICYDDQDCAEKLGQSLFIIGEMGSSDYYHALLRGKTIDDVNYMVFDVIRTIIEGVRRVIQIGASKVLIPGTFPLGCFPAYISAFRVNHRATYDEHGCSNDLNNLSIHHNNQLQRAIEKLKQKHHNVTIVYGDYHTAFTLLLKSFNAKTDLKSSCCGIGGRYNFTPTKMCGAQGVPVCANPDSYIIWDGLNLTQQAYRILVRLFLQHYH